MLGPKCSNPHLIHDPFTPHRRRRRQRLHAHAYYVSESLPDGETLDQFQIIRDLGLSLCGLIECTAYIQDPRIDPNRLLCTREGPAGQLLWLQCCTLDKFLISDSDLDCSVTVCSYPEFIRLCSSDLRHCDHQRALTTDLLRQQRTLQSGIFWCSYVQLYGSPAKFHGTVDRPT
jgi:hypothetical protein